MASPACSLAYPSAFLDDQGQGLLGQLIERHRGGLAGLAWFLDDDLLDEAALAGLERGYAARLRRLALRQRPWFERMGSQWWLATEALAAKYADMRPTLLPLAPPPERVRATNLDPGDGKGRRWWRP